MSIILGFRTVRQEDHYESEASICYIVSSSLVIEAYVFFKNPKSAHLDLHKYFFEVSNGIFRNPNS